MLDRAGKGVTGHTSPELELLAHTARRFSVARYLRPRTTDAECLSGLGVPSEAIDSGGPGTIKILIILVLIIRTRPDLSVTLIAVIVVVLRTDDAGQGGLRPSASRASLPASSSKGRP